MTLAVCFDIDGTLITSGGAGGVSWRRAFSDLYGIAAHIGEFSDAGMFGRRLDPSEVLIVGDTPRDVEAGHAAGAPVLGVASGRFSTTELREAGADYVLDSLEDDFPLWKSDDEEHQPEETK